MILDSQTLHTLRILGELYLDLPPGASKIPPASVHYFRKTVEEAGRRLDALPNLSAQSDNSSWEPLPSGWARTAFFECSACEAHDRSPRFGRLQIDEAFLVQLLQMREAVRKAKCSSISKTLQHHAVVWHPTCLAADLRIRSMELTVYDGADFCFRGSPKYGGDFESVNIDIDDLVAQARAALDGEDLYFANDRDDLVDIVHDVLHDEANSLPA